MKRFISKLIRSLKFIGVFLYWLIYIHQTEEERLKYRYGSIKGMECLGKTRIDGKYHLVYDRSREPMRDYLTFREFMNSFGFLIRRKYNVETLTDET